MKLQIHFNYPTNKASVSCGASTTDDEKMDFRLGVIPESDPKNIRWIQPGWFSGSSKDVQGFAVGRKDKVVFERKSSNAKETETRNTIDINKQWPLNAEGMTSVETPWEF